MFTRGDPAKAIANLKQENRGLFDEIRAFVDKWVSKLRSFYKDQSISMEGEMVAQLERFEELQKLFMEAVQGAGENYREAVETTGDITPGKEGVVETAVKQADRDLEADAKFSLRNAPDDMTIMERELVRLAGKYEKLDSKAGMHE